MKAKREGKGAWLSGVMAVAAAAALAVPGCNRGASFPDGSKVQAAQKKWCATLAEILAPEGQADGWDDRSSCEGSYPTGAAEYVARMAECFKMMAGRDSDEPMDLRQTAADCTEQVLVDLGGEVKGLEIVRARCARTERCQEDVTMDECLEGFEDMPLSERSRLSTMYNWAAQEDIASCLSGGCSDDEDAAMVECYEDAHEDRLWLPD